MAALSNSTHRFARSAGRFRKKRKRVAHRTRENVSLLEPVHVTLRVCPDVPSLRQRHVDEVLRRIFCAMKDRAQFHLVQYSIQGNHLHMIIEADSRDALTRGMISLMTRIARNLNKLFGRIGKFFADRYHAARLATPKRVRRTLVYVFGNAWHHGLQIRACMDRYSSAPWFRAWLEDVRVKFPGSIECPVEEASSWLLSVGYKNLGPISVFERPA